ncbi:hypothetical protein AALO_G00180820 [Alosa alosa]|uniref:Uncharacterized protein n=1 Tax=Alosa alosa TaxID=278164 RepID=A0AAV6GFD9_9TELE|nr:hypothetical protein AALO_G00180820 [Alosa alosa]
MRGKIRKREGKRRPRLATIDFGEKWTAPPDDRRVSGWLQQETAVSSTRLWGNERAPPTARPPHRQIPSEVVLSAQTS